jgi:hypothetical protein
LQEHAPHERLELGNDEHNQMYAVSKSETRAKLQFGVM